MHQISLGLFLDRGGASGFAGGFPLTAWSGATLTDAAGTVLTHRTIQTSGEGIAPAAATRIDFTEKDA